MILNQVNGKCMSKSHQFSDELYTSRHLELCWEYPRKETPGPGNYCSSTQLLGAFIHSQNQEEAVGWVETDLVKGQRKTGLIF